MSEEEGYDYDGYWNRVINDPSFIPPFGEEMPKKPKPPKPKTFLDYMLNQRIERAEVEFSLQNESYGEFWPGDNSPYGCYVGVIENCYAFMSQNNVIRALSRLGGALRDLSPHSRYLVREKAQAYFLAEAKKNEHKSIHKVNVHCANTAYSQAREGDLISACNVIMDALSHGYKVGTFTVEAITHILIENGHVPDDFLRKSTCLEKKSRMLDLVAGHNLSGALRALLFHDEDGACKSIWSAEDRKEFNIRKWELHDALVKEGCKFKRGSLVKDESERV